MKEKPPVSPLSPLTPAEERRLVRKSLIVIGIGLAAAFAVLVAAAVSKRAQAHGDAAWIMQDSRTAYCCGPSDCERAPISAVKPINGGWLIPSTDQSFMEGSPDLHPSKDQDFWWRKPPNLGGKVKCLFVPAGGA